MLFMLTELKDRYSIRVMNMKIETFTLGVLSTNAYLLYHQTNKAGVVIDPGENPDPLLARIKELELKIEAILLTHAHFDHIAGLNPVRAFTEAPVYIHTLEKDWLHDPQKNGSALWLEHTPVSCSPADFILEGGETLTFFGETFQVIHTPGHSPGSVTYHHQAGMFSGDVLFAGSIGRTDLPGGDYQQLVNTLQSHFLNQPGETNVYPGHGPKTTIEKEKKTNPFLQS